MPKGSSKSAFANLRERKAHAANVVGLTVDRQARRHRLIKSDRSDYLAVMWPAPDYPNGEKEINLSFLLRYRNLSGPFAEAILEAGKERNLELPSIESLVTALKHGFCQYLETEELNSLTLDELTTQRLNQFINFLNQAKGGVAVWQVATREGRVHAFRAVYEWLKKNSPWANMFPNDSQLRKNIWAGQKDVTTKPSPVIPWADFRLIYQACLREITATMERVSDMRAQMQAELENPIALMPEPGERTSTPIDGKSKNPYRSLGLMLATIKNRYPTTLLSGEFIGNLNDRALKNAVAEFHGGLISVSECFYPNPRALVPFVVMMAIHLDYNLETLLTCKVKDFGIRPNKFGRAELDVLPTVVGEDGIRVKSDKSFTSDAQKKRAHGKAQHRVIPVTDDPDHPATIVQFLLEWSRDIRGLAEPRFVERLFLFVPEKSAKVKSYQGRISAGTDGCWTTAYIRFFKENGLTFHPFKTFRATGLDITEVLFDGDLRAKQAAANHTSHDTTYRKYTTAGQMARGDEALGEIVETRKRWRESKGKIDPRSKPEGADLGAATPGWICIDPYDSPYGRPDNLCVEYGKCPDCPHGSLDVNNSYSVAQAWNLLSAIDDAASELAPDAWLDRWAPVKQRLLNHWLPTVPPHVADEARTKRMSPLPPLE